LVASAPGLACGQCGQRFDDVLDHVVRHHLAMADSVPVSRGRHVSGVDFEISFGRNLRTKLLSGANPATYKFTTTTPALKKDIAFFKVEFKKKRARLLIAL
jgi:hypothetical protein